MTAQESFAQWLRLHWSRARLRDRGDAASVVRRRGDTLDNRYVLHLRRQCELALDDSTPAAEHTRLRAGKGWVMVGVGA